MINKNEITPRAKITAICVFFFTTISVIAADEVTLHLPDYAEPQTNKTAEVVARHMLDHSGRPPLEMLGERYDALLARADIVIAIRITNVVLCAVTRLDEWFDQNTTPVFWYTVHGELLDTVRGTFDGTAIKFQTSCGMHRNTWPYVTSFAYQLGLEKTRRCGAGTLGIKKRRLRELFRVYRLGPSLSHGSGAEYS